MRPSFSQKVAGWLSWDEGHGAGGHLGHPLFHPAEGAVLEGGEHGLFFQPGVKDGVDDPVHDLFVPVQVGL